MGSSKQGMPSPQQQAQALQQSGQMDQRWQQQALAAQGGVPQISPEQVQADMLRAQGGRALTPDEQMARFRGFDQQGRQQLQQAAQQGGGQPMTGAPQQMPGGPQQLTPQQQMMMQRAQGQRQAMMQQRQPQPQTGKGSMPPAQQQAWNQQAAQGMAQQFGRGKQQQMPPAGGQ